MRLLDAHLVGRFGLQEGVDLAGEARIACRDVAELVGDRLLELSIDGQSYLTHLAVERGERLPVLADMVLDLQTGRAIDQGADGGIPFCWHRRGLTDASALDR